MNIWTSNLKVSCYQRCSGPPEWFIKEGKKSKWKKGDSLGTKQAGKGTLAVRRNWTKGWEDEEKVLQVQDWQAMQSWSHSIKDEPRLRIKGRTRNQNRQICPEAIVIFNKGNPLYEKILKKVIAHSDLKDLGKIVNIIRRTQKWDLMFILKNSSLPKFM